jgi:hypothetical protein
MRLERWTIVIAKIGMPDPGGWSVQSQPLTQFAPKHRRTDGDLHILILLRRVAVPKSSTTFAVLQRVPRPYVVGLSCLSPWIVRLDGMVAEVSGQPCVQARSQMAGFFSHPGQGQLEACARARYWRVWSRAPPFSFSQVHPPSSFLKLCSSPTTTLLQKR